jgi:hypothetical protein
MNEEKTNTAIKNGLTPAMMSLDKKGRYILLWKIAPDISPVMKN